MHYVSRAASALWAMLTALLMPGAYAGAPSLCAQNRYARAVRRAAVSRSRRRPTPEYRALQQIVEEARRQGAPVVAIGPAGVLEIRDPARN